MEGKFVIVRTYSAGVHCGILSSLKDKAAVLTDARRTRSLLKTWWPRGTGAKHPRKSVVSGSTCAWSIDRLYRG